MKIKLLFIIVIILNVFLISAYPTITPYVNDFANILSADEEGQLQAYLELIEAQSGYEIVVLTVNNTNGEGRTMFANRVGEENGVGKKDESNGLIVMWSLENEKGGGIAVGRGAESIFNDAKVGRIGKAHRHYFDDELYYDGFINIIDDIYQELNVSSDTHDINHPKETEITGGMIIALIIFIVVIIVLYLMFPEFFLFLILIDLLSSMFKSGGRGVSFGGGSFGGGGSDF